MLLKRLAAGGMAEVFLSRPSSRDANGRVQVVKRILPHIADHSAFLNMFQREIRIIMGFNHPHIVQLHDFGRIGGQPFISMEYIEGKSVKEIMMHFWARGEQIPVPVVLSLIAQAASGLSYAHEFVNKVTGEELHAIHRDISPHNLIVSYEGNLKVIDFGIAKAACSIPEFTQTGVVKGKAAYFAPEQLSGQAIDSRTDVFALGIVLWEMLAGERLFMKEGDSEVTTMQRVSNCEQHIVPPSAYNKAVPADVDEIVLLALKKNPDERLGSAKKLQAMLRETMIRHFPTFSYSNVGEMMSNTFAPEIELERKNVRELNNNAQAVLVGTPEEKTETLTSGFPNTLSGYHNVSQTDKTHTNTKIPKVAPREGAPSSVLDIRLSNIEKMMKQKASTRHYVLFAFYVVALLAMKVSERWDISVIQERADASEKGRAYSRGTTMAKNPQRGLASAPKKLAGPEKSKKQ